jgi:Cys-rich four helix bundle protein (predicted Tat secretion target)
MNRREAITTVGATTVAAAAAAALGAGIASAEQGHKGHVQENHHEDMVKSASHCAMLAEQCAKVCYDQLEAGDKSMAECGRKLEELIATCNAIEKMSIYNSIHLKEMANLTAKVCEESEKECLKHKDHKQCVDCAVACNECIEQCKKIA